MKKNLVTVKFKDYVSLTKPGIIRGNLLTALAGFLLASKGNVHFTLLFYTLLGVALLIACGCVFNNYIDREIDKKMARTSKRALVTGKIKTGPAIIYGSVLGITGAIILGVFVNHLTLLLGIVSIFIYVVVYGAAKRRSVHGTVVGSIPGATSLVAGYTAVTGRLDLETLLLFLVLAVWQMPHFYAIATFRRKDYASAGIPVLSVKKGLPSTKRQIVAYIALFGFVTILLWAYGYVGITYLAVMSLASMAWLRLGLMGFKAPDDDVWGHKMFRFSLLVLLAFCLMISIDSFLP
jgi:protoheme IX farnesyltransferase